MEHTRWLHKVSAANSRFQISNSPQNSLSAVRERRHRYAVWLHLQLSVVDGPRTCTDVAACILMVAVFSIAGLCSGFAVFLGNPAWIRAEIDYHAQLCQSHEKPYIYWPTPPELQWKVCVASCPDASDTVNSNHADLPVLGSVAIQRSIGEMKVSQSVWVSEHPVYPTKLAFGRFCLAEPDTVLQTRREPAHRQTTAEAALLTPLREMYGTPLLQFRRFLGDLSRQPGFATSAAGLVSAAFFAGALPLLLLRRLPAFGATLAILGGIVGTILTGLTMITAGSMDALDHRVIAVADLQPGLAFAAGWVMWLAAAAMSVVVLFFRHALCRSATVLSKVFAIVDGDSRLRSLWLLPFLATIVQLSGLSLFALVLPNVFSIADIDWQPEEMVADDSRAGARFVSDRARLFQASEIDNEWIPTIVGAVRRLVFADTLSLGMAVALVVAVRLWLATVDCLSYISVSFIVSQWYFARDQASSDASKCLLLWRGVGVALRYHLGTAALRGFVVAFVPLPWRFIRSIALCAAVCADSETETGEDDGDAEQNCRAFNVRDLVVALSPISLVGTAVLGENLNAAFVNAVAGLSTALPAARCVVGSTVLINLLIALPISLSTWPASILLAKTETARVATAIILCACAHISTSTWATVSEATVDAFLYCFILDDAAHRSFGFGKEVKDDYPELSHRASPCISANTSYALWSSACTPALLRELLFDISQDLLEEFETGDDEGEVHSLVGERGSDREHDMS